MSIALDTQRRAELQSALENFNSWAMRYDRKTDPNDEEIKKGLALAKARQNAVLELIRSDPAQAIAKTIPVSLRSRLPSELNDELEAPVSGTGDLLVICDLPTQNSHEPARIRRLARFNGQVYEAFVDGQEPWQITRFNIPLQGIALKGALALNENVKSFQPVQLDSRGISGPRFPLTRPSPTKNRTRVIVIRTDFCDLPGDPQFFSQHFTASLVQHIADTQIATYYHRSSYGRLTMEFTVTPKVYRLPLNASKYATIGVLDPLYNDAVGAATTDYCLNDFDAVVVLCSWLGNLTGSSILSGGYTFIGTGKMLVNGEFDFRVVAHELGHCFGLPHANYWESQDENPVSNHAVSRPYGDPFDTMGANFANDSRVDFNPWFKNQLGWIRDEQVLTVTNSGVFRIHSFDDSQATDALAIKVSRNGALDYWIGLRGQFTKNATYVIWGYHYLKESDLLGLSSTSKKARDAQLPVETAFADEAAGLTIFPIAGGDAEGNACLDVLVTLGSPPIITSQPRAQKTLVGEPASFKVGVRGDFPPYFTWQRRPRGGDAWVGLTDDNNCHGSSSAELSINKTASSMDGDSFRCLLTNAAGGFNCSQTALLSVSDLGVMTLAGQAGARGFCDGPASIAQFSSPAGIAVDCPRNCYVTDSENHVVRMISPDGMVVTLAGTPGQPGCRDGFGTNAEFNFPVGIAVDCQGNVFVADQRNSTIRKITSAGLVTTLAGLAGVCGSRDGTSSEAQFNHPGGVAVDCLGNLYVSDTDNHVARKIEAEGIVSTIAGLAGVPGTTDGPAGSARFNHPVGIAVDSTDSIYIADQNNSTIRKIFPDGTVTTLAGAAGVVCNTDGTGDTARFSYPTGLAVDGVGNVYVADRNNSSIRRITPAGNVVTIAGAAGNEGVQDGDCSLAQFTFPTGVATDSQGGIYVADTSNNTIRLIRASAPLLPVLQETFTQGRLILSWPTSAEGFVLQSRSSFSTESEWSPAQGKPATIGCNFVLTNYLEAPATFFRLIRP